MWRGRVKGNISLFFWKAGQFRVWRRARKLMDREVRHRAGKHICFLNFLSNIEAWSMRGFMLRWIKIPGATWLDWAKRRLSRRRTQRLRMWRGRHRGGCIPSGRRGTEGWWWARSAFWLTLYINRMLHQNNKNFKITWAKALASAGTTACC